LNIDVNWKQIIKSTWRTLSPNLTEARKYFYETLFEASPSSKDLFNLSDGEHEKKLKETIFFLVERIDSIESYAEEIKKLGLKHKGYGVKKAHYPVFGEVLIDTLQKFLSEDWNEAYEITWKWFYQEITRIMLIPKSKKAVFSNNFN